MAHRSMGNGVIRCFIYSLANSEIAPGEGRVVTMKFATTAGVSEGTYSLTFDNLKAGTADLVDKIAGGDNECSFNVVHRIIGDVNCDGYVTSADITALYSYLLSNDTTYLDTSDVNGDGVITSADVTTVYSIVLGN